jgi:PPM family protein phosphatase
MNLNKALDVVRLTDTGKKREHNEDAVASDVEIGLVVLADGMGGYNAGEVASEIATLSIIADLKESMHEFEPGQVDAISGMQMESVLIQEAVSHANKAIYDISQSQPQCAGMGFVYQ